MLKNISLEEVVQKSGSKPIYAVTLVDENTTLSDLKYAVGFYEDVKEDKHEINQDWVEDTPEEPVEEQEETTEEVKQEETVREKRKPIDHGKICALWKGKWDAAKIADEMGCSIQTVYNHVDKEGLR